MAKVMPMKVFFSYVGWGVRLRKCVWIISGIEDIKKFTMKCSISDLNLTQQVLAQMCNFL